MKDHIWLVTKWNDNHIDSFIESLDKGEPYKIIDQKETGWPLAKAWNVGLELTSRYKTVIITNDDVIVNKETGMRLSKILGLMGEPTKTLLLSAYDINLHGNLGNVWLPSKVFHPQSFLFAVDKRLPELIGKFDEQFEPYLFEDTDMFQRVTQAGYDWATAVPVWHEGGGSTPTTDEINWRNMIFMKNRLLYLEKWGGAPGEETKVWTKN